MANDAQRAAPDRHTTDPARFIAALLAPLPAGEEPVDTPRFRRQLDAAERIKWDEHMDDVRIAEAQHTIAAIRLRRSGEGVNEECLWRYQEAHTARLRQCTIAAPGEKELRWKLRQVKALDPRRSDVARALACIEADRARLKMPENAN